MEPTETKPDSRAFCSECGTRLDVGARFCHQCGAQIAGGARGGRGPAIPRAGVPRAAAWVVPALALVVLVVLVAVQYSSRDMTMGSSAGGAPLAMGRAPDISA